MKLALVVANNYPLKIKTYKTIKFYRYIRAKYVYMDERSITAHVTYKNIRKITVVPSMKVTRIYGNIIITNDYTLKTTVHFVFQMPPGKTYLPESV